MSGIALHEKRLRAAQFQFIFPFSLDHNCQDKLERELLTDGFVSFSLQQEELETAFYGSGCEVSHRRLEKFFLPFAKNMIFPRQPDAHAFRRYSKRIDLPCRMTANEHHWRFHLHAADMFVCPFDIGFLTLRVELTDGGEPAFTFSQALAFASRFRMLQSMNEAERNIRIGAADCESEEVEDFIFKTVVPALTRFLDESDLEESFFEKLPYFVDERMYVQGLLAFERQEEITTVDAYRASRLDGMDDRGRPYVSACNTAYIERFCSERIYDRWSPETWYMIEETSSVCLTRQSGHRVKQLVSHIYGEYYYALLINLFHKIVLLKLSNRYSHVQIDKDPDKIEKLIRDITTFSSKKFLYRSGIAVARQRHVRSAARASGDRNVVRGRETDAGRFVQIRGKLRCQTLELFAAHPDDLHGRQRYFRHEPGRRRFEGADRSKPFRKLFGVSVHGLARSHDRRRRRLRSGHRHDRAACAGMAQKPA